MILFGFDETAVLGTVTSVGAGGLAVAVMIYFLKYLEKKDADQKVRDENMLVRIETLVDRVDAMDVRNTNVVKEINQRSVDANRETVKEFSVALSEFRKENRATVDGLIAVHREASSTVGAIAGQVGNLGNQVGSLATQVATHGTKIGHVAAEVHELKDEVGGIKTHITKEADRVKHDPPRGPG